jgi:hypothetical protein
VLAEKQVFLAAAEQDVRRLGRSNY